MNNICRIPLRNIPSNNNENYETNIHPYKNNQLIKQTIIHTKRLLQENITDLSQIPLQGISVNIQNPKASISNIEKRRIRLLTKQTQVHKKNKPSCVSNNNNKKKSKASSKQIKVNIIKLPLSTSSNEPINPLMCAEYIDDIYTYLKSIENQNLPNGNYMKEIQQDINPRMRDILYDWLIEVHLKFKLLPETLFLTFNIIDRYLSKETIHRKYLQLLGVTAMFIACKYEEIYPPEIKDFIYMTDNSYTKDEMIKMENNILKSLEFNVTNPSPLRFLEILKQYLKLPEKTFIYCQFLLELSVINYNMIKYNPCILAACSIYLEHMLQERKNDNIWKDYSYMDLLWEVTQIKKDSNEIKECLNYMCFILCEIQGGKYQAVKKKYSLDKYMGVALEEIKINKEMICTI